MANLDFGLLFGSTITLTVPLVLAAMGGLTSERSGIMNIALEGTMLGACCTVALVGKTSQNAIVALLAGLVVGVILMLIHALLTQKFRIDHIISGMAINAFCIGGTNFLSKLFLNDTDMHKTPFLPVQLYWAFAMAIVIGVFLYLKKTKGGLHLLAVGNDPDKSRQMGIEPLKVRFLALIATGVFCGLSGALIVSNSGSFTDNMTAGRGYIALAALIIGGWKPVPTLIACAIFGLIDALQLNLQGTKLSGADLPPELWSALPYLVTLVALAGLLGKSRPPSGLGKQ